MLYDRAPKRRRRGGRRYVGDRRLSRSDLADSAQSFMDWLLSAGRRPGPLGVHPLGGLGGLAVGGLQGRNVFGFAQREARLAAGD